MTKAVITNFGYNEFSVITKEFESPVFFFYFFGVSSLFFDMGCSSVLGQHMWKMTDFLK